MARLVDEHSHAHVHTSVHVRAHTRTLHSRPAVSSISLLKIFVVISDQSSGCWFAVA